MLSRILGLVRDTVIASVWGAGFATDAFFVAFKVPNLLRRLVAEGALSSAFIPIYTESVNKSECEARKTLQATLSLSLALTLIATILGLVFSVELSHFFAPGFSEVPGKIALASDLMQVMFPYIILVSLLAVLSGALNVHGVFMWPALAPAILNVVLITAAFLFSHLGIEALAWGVLLGGLAALIPQVFIGMKLAIGVGLSKEVLSSTSRAVLKLMAPAVLGASVYQLMIFINTLLASLLVEGSVSWLYYADRLFQFPLGVFSMALATAVLPKMSKAGAKNDLGELSEVLVYALKWSTLLSVPAAFGLAALAEPLIGIVYQRGSFDAHSAEQTAFALKAFVIGLWPISCQTMITRAFLARKNTKTPALVAVLTLAINLIFALSLMGVIKGESQIWAGEFLRRIQTFLPVFELSHSGLALAGSLSTLVSCIILAMLLRGEKLEPDWLQFFKTATRSLIASGCMYAALFGMGKYLSGFILVAVGVPLGALVYLVSLLIFKDPDVKGLLGYFKNRLLTKGGDS